MTATGTGTSLRTRPELAGGTRPIGTDDASLGERAGIHRFREEDSQTRTDANGRAVRGGVSRGGVSRGGVSRVGRRRERSNGYMLSISNRAHRPRTSLFSAFPHTPTRRSIDRTNEPVDRTGRTGARRGEREGRSARSGDGDARDMDPTLRPASAASRHAERFNLVKSTEAAKRNAAHISAVVREYVSTHARGKSGTFDMLELACGTGTHAVCVARECAGFLQSYAPTDVCEDAFESVRANADEARREGGDWAGVLAPPAIVDAAAFDACVARDSLDGVLVVNMAHISSDAANRGMFRGCGEALRSGGLLFVYGPFSYDGGKFRSEGDAKFDASLRTRDPENFGLVDEEWMDGLANEAGLDVVEHRDMPANNLTLVYRKR